MTTTAKKPTDARPFGPWDGFQDCMDDVMSRQGYDEETARKVCGALKAKLEDGAAAPAKRTRADAAPPYRATTNLGAVDEYSRTVMVLASTPSPVDGEAITSWDLGRFLSNPVVLWAHNADENALPIGTASEVEWDPAVGLRMRVKFARAEANPLAEQVFQAAIDGIVRAVSVGYDVGPPEDAPEGTMAAGGAKAKVRRGKLLEVSFVPIGADEDAGTPALNPEAAAPDEPSDEELRTRVSAAASELAKHRARIKRAATMTRSDGEGKPCGCGGEAVRPGERTDSVDVPDGCVLRMDRGPVRLDRAELTPAGGRRIPARLSRTGVLVYMNADGTTRRELRLPEDIFRADSLATLEDAPVIDISHHSGMVTPRTWKAAALGHARSARRDGQYIAADLVVDHGDALDAIAQGERAEISCGYTCRLDMTPGEWQGERYDCVQREIRYNHVALCPPNRGRAGPEVGLRLDNRTPAWAVAHFNHDEEDTMAVKVRLDGKEYEEGSREHLDAVERHNAAALERARLDARAELDKAVAAKDAELGEAKKRLDAAEGERDAAKTALEQFKADAAAAKTKADGEEADRKKAERAQLRQKIRLVSEIARFFGDDSDEEDEEEDDGKGGKKKAKRLDADDRFDALLDMSERELMLRAIKKGQPAFDDQGRSDDYLRSRYDTLLAHVREQRGVDGVARVAADHARRLDATGRGREDGGTVEQARRKREDVYANAWRGQQGGVPGK